VAIFSGSRFLLVKWQGSTVRKASVPSGKSESIPAPLGTVRHGPARKVTNRPENTQKNRNCLRGGLGARARSPAPPPPGVEGRSRRLRPSDGSAPPSHPRGPRPSASPLHRPTLATRSRLTRPSTSSRPSVVDRSGSQDAPRAIGPPEIHPKTIASCPRVMWSCVEIIALSPCFIRWC
jgi:hypothetical protein